MKPHRAIPATSWLRPSAIFIGTLKLFCVALLAVAAVAVAVAATPAFRPAARAHHTAAAPAFRLYIPDRYVVVLDDPPVAARFSTRVDAGSSAAADYRRSIEAKQAAVVSELASRHIQVSSQVSHLLNALFVWAPGHSIEEMRAIPGVKSVTPMRRMKAELNRAVQLTDAQSAWNAVGGQSNAGKGIKIAILDSGIDLTNPAFQDSSLTMPSGYPLCSGFPYPPLPYPTSGPCSLYTNTKVIVARSYMQLLGAGSGAATSEPDDPYPHDRDGHGTATAMIAAGNSIAAPAISTGGSPITLQGMASKAYIGVYKIAGAFGITNEEVEIQALEDAVKDGMDVISMSYGAPALTGCTVSNCSGDPAAAAFELAATSARPAGSLSSSIPIPVIVTSAGNNGSAAGPWYPSFNTITSPSNAPDVISVGASTNSHIMQPSVSATAAGAPSNIKNIVALPGNSYFYPSASGANTAKLVDVSKAGDATACSSLPGKSLANSVALIVSSGTCSSYTAALNAQNAGAVGFIFISPAGTAVAPFDAGPSMTASTATVSINWPAVAVSNGDGMNLKNYIDANPGQQVTIDLGGQEQDVTTLSQAWVSATGYSALTANMVPGYSSFGPTPDGQMKPDIVATGGWDPAWGLPGGFYVPTQTFDAYDPTLYNAYGSYSANGFMAVDGTSFSAALTAGAAALAIQAHPGLARGTQVRSLIVNSSAQSVTTDDYAPPNPVDAEWIGAGLLDAGAAAAATVTAEPATVSFGIVSGSLPIAKTITLTNTGSGSVTLSPKVTCCTENGGPGSLSGATVAASPSSIALGAGVSATLTVTLSGSVPAAGEYSGSIALGSGLHIPFMLLVGAGNNCSTSADQCNVFTIVAPENFIAEGAPGSDLGPQPFLQVTDAYGAPVAGASVTFKVGGTGSLTLNGVSGEPACSPSSSSTSITCPTDQYGWVWLDAVLGSTTGQPTVTYAVGPISDYVLVNIQTPPVISKGGVADAASYATTLVPGSYAAIFGSGLSEVASDIFSLQCPLGACVYPIGLDYVSVSFDAGGATYPGYPWYVSPGQVNLVVPWELEGQTSAQVKLSIDDDLYSNVITVPIANYNPAFFVSCGAACALDYPGYNLITTSNPAKRGSTIMLYANGLGPVTNPPGDGVPAGNGVSAPYSVTTTTPIVTIGGAQAQVSWCGLAPGYQADYQINVVVPATAQTGNSVPISVQIGGVTSPSQVAGTAVTIPVQ